MFVSHTHPLCAKINQIQDTRGTNCFELCSTESEMVGRERGGCIHVWHRTPFHLLSNNRAVGLKKSQSGVLMSLLDLILNEDRATVTAIPAGYILMLETRTKVFFRTEKAIISCKRLVPARPRTLLRRIISRFCDNPWPPRSPDWSMCGFYIFNPRAVYITTSHEILTSRRLQPLKKFLPSLQRYPCYEGFWKKYSSRAFPIMEIKGILFKK